jgi:TRAP-type C4-dicarboxylate transport system permease small subunit
MRSAGALLRVAQGFESAVEAGCKAVMLVAGLGLLALLSAVVFLRYLLESGLTFAPDLGELLFALFVLAGVVMAARRGAHVATQVLMNALPQGGRRVLAVFIHLVTAGVYALLARYGVENAIIAHAQTTPVLRIPWSVGYGALTFALVLVSLCSVTAIIRLVAGRERVVVDMAEPGAATT